MKVLLLAALLAIPFYVPRDHSGHAGHTVRLTGDMKGDTITVSKIVMPAKKAS